MANTSSTSESLQDQVRKRANRLCEYCHTNEQWQYVQFTLDHVVPRATGGQTVLDNLALACFHCNRRKTNKQTALDPNTGKKVGLYNPRLSPWKEHFKWTADGLRIAPQTALGRATVYLLDMNRDRVLLIRQADINVNRHPPEGDPVEETND